MKVCMTPLALTPDEAAKALGISGSDLTDLVVLGKIRGPIKPHPNMDIWLYDVGRLAEDWQEIVLEDEENRAVIFPEGYGGTS